MILHIPSDGSGEQALAQLVAQHRAAFFAGVQHDFEDTQAEPQEAGSACSEFLEDSQEVQRPMQALAGVLLASAATVALIGAGILATAV
jgi:hypothetical protein